MKEILRTAKTRGELTEKINAYFISEPYYHGQVDYIICDDGRIYKTNEKYLLEDFYKVIYNEGNFEFRIEV